MGSESLGAAAGAGTGSVVGSGPGAWLGIAVGMTAGRWTWSGFGDGAWLWDLVGGWGLGSGWVASLAKSLVLARSSASYAVGASPRALPRHWSLANART